jgi:hypothetical protein
MKRKSPSYIALLAILVVACSGAIAAGTPARGFTTALTLSRSSVLPLPADESNFDPSPLYANFTITNHSRKDLWLLATVDNPERLPRVRVRVLALRGEVVAEYFTSMAPLIRAGKATRANFSIPRFTSLQPQPGAPPQVKQPLPIGDYVVETSLVSDPRFAATGFFSIVPAGEFAKVTKITHGAVRSEGDLDERLVISVRAMLPFGTEGSLNLRSPASAPLGLPPSTIAFDVVAAAPTETVGPTTIDEEFVIPRPAGVQTVRLFSAQGSIDLGVPFGYNAPSIVEAQLFLDDPAPGKIKIRAVSPEHLVVWYGVLRPSEQQPPVNGIHTFIFLEFPPGNVVFPAIVPTIAWATLDKTSDLRGIRIVSATNEITLMLPETE